MARGGGAAAPYLTDYRRGVLAEGVNADVRAFECIRVWRIFCALFSFLFLLLKNKVLQSSSQARTGGTKPQ
jgi:hypothetical protein